MHGGNMIFFSLLLLKHFNIGKLNGFKTLKDKINTLAFLNCGVRDVK